ncbi:hypothetical protein EVAR_94227_1 [Eumeta japonica]|uniref:Uncharacterized protein n=1 Tax=Eumeta variegata TaxID=151549 RepID=A0A4C1UN08_EUMVA|nr:hypothetical protein EVAR_94227_1 [Eumeta japonica]
MRTLKVAYLARLLEKEYHEIDPDNIEAVLLKIERDPTTSIRMISRRTGISTATLHRSLHERRYHLYHFRKVQDLLPIDYEIRVLFCEEMLRKSRENPKFLMKFLDR